jgi:hypothetical protein
MIPQGWTPFSEKIRLNQYAGAEGGRRVSAASMIRRGEELTGRGLKATTYAYCQAVEPDSQLSFVTD